MVFLNRGLGDGLVIPKMVEFKNCEEFEDLRLPRCGALGSKSSTCRPCHVHWVHCVQLQQIC